MEVYSTQYYAKVAGLGEIFVQRKFSAVQYEPSCTHVNTENPPPVNLDNLLFKLRPQVGSKWYQFGEAAGIDKETLDKFAEQCSPQDCIVEVLDCWLRSGVEVPTWKAVAEILKAIGLTGLGLDIDSWVQTTGIPCLF